MSTPIRSNFFRIALLATLLVSIVFFQRVNRVRAAGGPIELAHNSYHVLAPTPSVSRYTTSR